MIRNRQEWGQWCEQHGTAGDMVYPILSDWEESDHKLLKYAYSLGFDTGRASTRDFDNASGCMIAAFEAGYAAKIHKKQDEKN